MSIFGSIGKAIGIASSAKSAAAAPTPPITTTKPVPAGTTIKERLASLINGIADTATSAAVIYVQDGKLTIGSFGASLPVTTDMLAAAIRIVAADITKPPSAIP